MNTQEFNCRPQATLNIEMRANLAIEGWDQPRLMIISDDAAMCNETPTGYDIRGRAGCKLCVPQGVELHIMRASADVNIKKVYGDIHIRKTNGSLRVNDIQNIAVGTVGGNVTAENVRGTFKVGGVGGNMNLNDTQLVGAASVGGSATFLLNPKDGQQFRVHAGGNITCQLPANVTAVVNVIDHRGGRKLIYGNVTESRDNDTPAHAEADAPSAITKISLVCGGNVEVHSPNPARSVDHFSQGWERIAETMEREFDQFGDWFEDFGAKIAINVQESVTGNIAQVLDQMRRKFAKAEWHAKRDAFRAEREARRHNAEHRWQYRYGRDFDKGTWDASKRNENPSTPAEAVLVQTVEPNAPKPEAHIEIVKPLSPAKQPDIIIPNDEIGDQERLLILQMVADRKITVDQAEQLLRALDGK
jgi:hypothetical protein